MKGTATSGVAFYDRGWEISKKMNYKRMECTAVAYGSKTFVCGGTCYKSRNGPVLTNCPIEFFANGTWTIVSAEVSPSTQLRFPGLIVSDYSQLLIIGGLTESGYSNRRYRVYFEDRQELTEELSAQHHSFHNPIWYPFKASLSTLTEEGSEFNSN